MFSLRADLDRLGEEVAGADTEGLGYEVSPLVCYSALATRMPRPVRTFVGVCVCVCLCVYSQDLTTLGEVAGCVSKGLRPDTIAALPVVSYGAAKAAGNILADMDK